MKRIILILIPLILIFIYHYIFNTIEDATELGLSRWVLGLFQTALTALILFFMFKAIFRENSLHSRLSQTLFDTFRKGYKHKTADIIPKTKYLDKVEIQNYLTKKGFNKLLEFNNRVVYKSDLFPKQLIDITITPQSGQLCIHTYPFINIYRTSSFPHLDAERIAALFR